MEFFVCSDYDMVNLAHDDSSWILDSGATCHVATRKEYFSSYTPGDFDVVRMGNTGLSRIAGIGDICLKFDTGMELGGLEQLSLFHYHHLEVFGCKAFCAYIKMKDQSLCEDKAHFGDDIQNDEEQNDEEHGADDVDAQEQPNLDEDVHPELPVHMPLFVPLRRSLESSYFHTLISANEYVFISLMGDVRAEYLCRSYGR
ncbi:hypothetical protein Tco_0485463 [Tanacetum coccineum]